MGGIPESVLIELIRLSHDSLLAEFYATSELPTASENRRPLPTTLLVTERARDFVRFMREVA